jgi:hypothetical protein
MATPDEGETALDEAALDAFADRMIGVLNAGCTALMTSIGHQTGLFGTLATSGPATSAQVAEAGGLNERYVREWLNTMTTAGSCGTTRVAHLYPAARARRVAGRRRWPRQPGPGYDIPADVCRG